MSTSAPDAVKGLTVLHAVYGINRSRVRFRCLRKLLALDLGIEVPHPIVDGLLEVHPACEDLLSPHSIWALVQKGV